MKKIMSLKETNELINIFNDLLLTKSISRFDSIYPANSTSFIRFELMKRVVNELVVLAVGIKSTAIVDDGENGLILIRINEQPVWHFPKIIKRKSYST